MKLTVEEAHAIWDQFEKDSLTKENLDRLLAILELRKKPDDDDEFLNVLIEKLRSNTPFQDFDGEEVQWVEEYLEWTTFGI